MTIELRKDIAYDNWIKNGDSGKWTLFTCCKVYEKL